MPKLNDKELEKLLKKGIIGLLQENDEGKEPQSMDIEELIRNSKQTNYSMINDSYTITKLNIATNNKGTSVAIDDPDFWKKVLKDEDTAAKLLTAEFLKLKDENEFMNEMSQRNFFIKLNEEVFNYIEKAKTEEINWDEEELFNEILRQIIDDPFVKEEIKKISEELLNDIKKKPRRLKKRNLSKIDKLLKIKSSRKKNIPLVVPKEEINVDEKKKEKRTRKKPEIDPKITSNDNSATNTKVKKSRSSKYLKKRESLNELSDENEFESTTKNLKKKDKKKSNKIKITESDNKNNSKSTKNGLALKQNSKKLKKIKTSDHKAANTNALLCLFCKQISTETENNDEDMQVKKCNTCSRTFHLTCFDSEFRSQLEKIKDSEDFSGNKFKLNKNLKKNNNKIFNPMNETCINCTAEIIDCSFCKKLGTKKVKLDSQVLQRVKNVLADTSRHLNQDSFKKFSELGNLLILRLR